MRIESQLNAIGYHDRFPHSGTHHGEGWTARVIVGNFFPKNALLYSLGKGEGFALNGKIYRPGNSAWTSIGVAHAL